MMADIHTKVLGRLLFEKGREMLTVKDAIAATGGGDNLSIDNKMKESLGRECEGIASAQKVEDWK